MRCMKIHFCYRVILCLTLSFLLCSCQQNPTPTLENTNTNQENQQLSQIEVPATFSNYDPMTYVQEEEFVTAKGVKLLMTYEEVCAIIGEPDEAYSNSDTVKSLMKDGIHYGFYLIDDAFDHRYDSLRDNEFYLLYLNYTGSSTEKMMRGLTMGQPIEEVFTHFPTKDDRLQKWAYQVVYGKQEMGEPHAFLEYTTVLGTYRILATTGTYSLNIHFDKNNCVSSVDLHYQPEN